MSECERNEWNLQKMNNKIRVTMGHRKAKHNNDNNNLIIRNNVKMKPKMRTK